MTLYAPSNVTSAVYDEEVGGCGKEHKAKKDERLAVSCSLCEPLIEKYATGWGRTPDQAARTEDEEFELEQAKNDTEKMLAAAGASLGREVAERAATAGVKPRSRKA